MPALPSESLRVIVPYAKLFRKRVFAHVQLLTLGALLAPGKRTITSALRIVGLDQDLAFHQYHRVLSHAGWPARTASQLLLGQLLNQFIGQQILGSPIARVLPAHSQDIIEFHEVWSYVHDKQQDRWLWTAICRRTRQMVGWSIGNHSQQTFKQLLRNCLRLPALSLLSLWRPARTLGGLIMYR